MGVLERKKEEKRQALLDAAYALFLEHGAAKTSVSDITDRARVAKGTFYLYFQDKDAVMQALLGRISFRVLDEACRSVEAQDLTRLMDKTVALVDFIIEYFRREKLVLRLLEHNFTWPSLAEFQTAAETSPVLAHIRGIIRTSPELEGLDEADVYRRMSALIGMCISMCYSCLINNKPDTIDAMKPVLYEIIRKAL